MDQTNLNPSLDICQESPLLEFKNVSAKYSNDEAEPFVVENLSFKLMADEKIGIVGRTGSGKSTIIKMIWRALEPTTGEINFRGRPTQKFSLQELRQNISILTQETTLFQGNLRDNLDISNLKSDTDIVLALQSVKFAHPNYSQKGLNMSISEDGGNLSEG